MQAIINSLRYIIGQLEDKICIYFQSFEQWGKSLFTNNRLPSSLSPQRLRGFRRFWIFTHSLTHLLTPPPPPSPPLSLTHSLTHSHSLNSSGKLFYLGGFGLKWQWLIQYFIGGILNSIHKTDKSAQSSNDVLSRIMPGQVSFWPLHFPTFKINSIQKW